jgi:hypothetical protein
VNPSNRLSDPHPEAQKKADANEGGSPAGAPQPHRRHHRKTASADPDPAPPAVAPAPVQRRRRRKQKRDPPPLPVAPVIEEESESSSNALVLLRPAPTLSTIASRASIDQSGPEGDYASVNLLTAIFSIHWVPRPLPKLAGDILFPPIVFPLFAFFRHADFLSETCSLERFFRTVDIFFEQFAVAKLSTQPHGSDDHLLTLLIIDLLMKSQKITNRSKDKVATFKSRIRKYVTDAVDKIISKSLVGFDSLVRRLLLSSVEGFDADSFIEEFKLVHDAVIMTYEFPESFRRYLDRRLLAALDARIMNKLLGNPSRLKMSAVVAWNSFLSPAESNGVNLTLFSELVRGLVMISVVDGALCADICPNLDPKVLLYCMQNWQLDEFMDFAVDWEPFASQLGVSGPIARPIVEPIPIPHFRARDAKWNLRDWNRVTLDHGEIKRLPFLKAAVAV